MSRSLFLKGCKRDVLEIICEDLDLSQVGTVEELRKSIYDFWTENQGVQIRGYDLYEQAFKLAPPSAQIRCASPLPGESSIEFFSDAQSDLKLNDGTSTTASTAPPSTPLGVTVCTTPVTSPTTPGTVVSPASVSPPTTAVSVNVSTLTNQVPTSTTGQLLIRTCTMASTIVLSGGRTTSPVTSSPTQPLSTSQSNQPIMSTQPIYPWFQNIYPWYQQTQPVSSQSIYPQLPYTLPVVSSQQMGSAVNSQTSQPVINTQPAHFVAGSQPPIQPAAGPQPPWPGLPPPYPYGFSCYPQTSYPPWMVPPGQLSTPPNPQKKSYSLNFAKECESRKIKSFRGEVGDRVSRFIEDIEDVVSFLRLSDEDLLAGFSKVLDGPALLRFRQEKNRYQTWADVKSDFYAAYQLLEFDPQDGAKMELRTMLSGETIDGYVAIMKDINKRLRQPKPPREFLYRLLENLSPEYRTALKDDVILNLDDLISAGRKFEEVRIRNLRYEPPPEFLRTDPIYGIATSTPISQRSAPRRFTPSQAGISSVWNLEPGDEAESQQEVYSYAFVAGQPPRIANRPPIPPPVLQTFQNENRGQIRCYNCSGLGHLSRDCPQPRQQGAIRCYRCNNMGHIARDCPQNAGQNSLVTSRDFSSQTEN